MEWFDPVRCRFSSLVAVDKIFLGYASNVMRRTSLNRSSPNIFEKIAQLLVSYETEAILKLHRLRSNNVSRRCSLSGGLNRVMSSSSIMAIHVSTPCHKIYHTALPNRSPCGIVSSRRLAIETWWWSKLDGGDWERRARRSMKLRSTKPWAMIRNSSAHVQKRALSAVFGCLRRPTDKTNSFFARLVRSCLEGISGRPCR